MNQQLVLGFLTSPWMLGWAAAAAIPILIHLWNGRQQHEVRWAAMQFLIAAAEKQAHRLHIQHRLLLAVRICVLLFLALALADPFLAVLPAWPPPASTAQVHTTIVIDGSYSMATRVGRETRFELAQQLAAELVDTRSQGAGFSLVVMANPPLVVVRDAVFDGGDLVEEIESLRELHTVDGLLPTLTSIEGVVDQVRVSHPRLTEHRVVFVTDLGRTTWAEVETPAVLRQLKRLSEKATIQVMTTDSAEAANVSITALRVMDPLPTVDEVVALEVDARNYGRGNFAGRLELLVNGTPIEQRDLEVPEGDQRTVSFAYQFGELGQHVVEARVSGDDLSVDNHRWLSVFVSSAIRVLCVDGVQGASELLAIALDPDSDGRSGVQVDVVGPDSLLESELRPYDCVLLNDVARIEVDEQAALKQFVEDGGGLVVVLGPRVDIAHYNAGLADASQERPLLPIRLDGVAGEELLRFDPLDYRHPIVRPFEGHERAGLLTAPTWRYMQLSPLGDQAQVVLEFDNGSPAMVAGQHGMGRTVVVATSLSAPPAVADVQAPWSALSLWTCFPPLVREVVEFTAASRADKYTTRVGGTLSEAIPSGRSVRLTIENPAGESERLPIDFDSTPPRWEYSATQLSGVYRVDSESPIVPSSRFAVNVEPAEGQLDRIEPASLPIELQRPLPANDLRASVGEGYNAPSLFRFCLAAVLALLVCESLLARRLGQGSG